MAATYIRLHPEFFKSHISYRPQRSCGKVMFSQTSVILFTEEVSAKHPPWADTPTPWAHPPPGQTPPPPGHPPPPPGQTLPPSWADTPTSQRILLECILVYTYKRGNVLVCCTTRPFHVPFFNSAFLLITLSNQYYLDL